MVEAWYATLNLVERRQALWLRYTIDAPREGPARPAVWGSFFDRARPERNFALREIHPADSVRPTDGARVVGIGPHELRRDGLRGEVSGGGHEIAWDLRFAPAPRPLHFVPKALGPVVALIRSGVFMVHPETRFDGEVTVDGERIAVAAAPGGQTHLWTRKRRVWAWGRCTAFAGADAQFEGISYWLGPVLVNVLAVRHGARVYEFNTGLRWARAWSEFGVPEWRFRARAGEVRLAGVARARPEDMLQVTYTDPDGEPMYCCNSEVADLELRLAGPDGETVLRAEATAALEFTSRSERPEVRRWV